MLFHFHPPSGHQLLPFYHLYISVFVLFKNELAASHLTFEIVSNRVFLLRAQQLHTGKHTRKWWQSTLSIWHMLFPCLEKTTLKISYETASHNKEIWFFQPWSIISREYFSPKNDNSSCTHPNAIPNQYDWHSSVVHKRRHFEECNGCSLYTVILFYGRPPYDSGLGLSKNAP